MNDVTEVVRNVLTDHKETRDSDFKLICWVYQTIKPDVMSMPFSKVMWNHKDYDLPSFETIRRTRQKLQHDCPDLRGEMYVKRINKQVEYIDRFVVGGPL